MKLSHHEKQQLASIGGKVYGDGKAPYWWGAKSMPKLAEKGLVEPHAVKGAWRITKAGKNLLAELKE